MTAEGSSLHPGWAVLVAFGSAIAVRIARSIALRRSLLDVPNSRSLHTLPVPRLGGAAFIPVVLAAVAVGWRGGALPGVVAAALLGGALALYAVSMIDDVRSLPTGVRFAVQCAAAGVFVWAAVRSAPAGSFDFIGALLSSSSSPSLPISPVFRFFPIVLSCVLLTLWIVGLLNIYNFMDGIDGIAGTQAVVAGLAWWAIGSAFHAPMTAWLALAAAAGALGFLTLNWPPAKIFMGDAGSTVLGFIFATVPLVAVFEIQSAVRFDSLLVAAVLVVWPFLADGTFTILRRLKNRENILKAHRSHLYQRLVIAGRSHWQITCLYGALAVIGAGLAWRVVVGAVHAIPVAIVVVAALFAGLWGWTVACEARTRSARPEAG